MLGAFRSCFKGQNHARDGGERDAPDAARAPPTSPDAPTATTTETKASSRMGSAGEAHPSPMLPGTNGTATAPVPGTAVVLTVQVPLSPFAQALNPPAPPAHAPSSAAPRAAEPSLEPLETLSSHCSSLDSSLINSANGPRPYFPIPPQPGRLNNGYPAAASYTAQALGPTLPAASTTSARPEELLMLGHLDNNNMGLMARPASLQLHQLNRQITNLQKIGQGAGGIVYRGLWTGVNVAIKFLKSSSPDQLNQTAKEAILSRFVSHPNVVQTYTYDVTLLVDSVVGMNAAHAAVVHPAAAPAITMPGIMEEDPDPMLQSRDMVESHATSAQALQLMPDLLGALPPAAPAAPAATAPAYSLALIAAGLSPLPPVQTTPSLAIFDIGSRSTMDVRASIMSQPDVDSMLGCPGWDMQDVLLRLGAKTGEYLTHIIMELCDAGTLQQAILNGFFGGRKDSSTERAKCRALLKTAREVVSGMQHLHSLGIIHGDLKPGNVLLRKDASSRTSFIAKVGDFGLAQRCGPGAPEVQAGVPLGTLCYAAPEALRGLLLKTSDVYSFGVMLWQMCSGAQPFHGLHPAQILYGKQTGSLKLSWPMEVYSPIRKLGELCTEMDPGARPHFDQIFKALVQIEQRLQQAAKARMPAPPVEQQRKAEEVEVYELMPDPEILP